MLAELLAIAQRVEASQREVQPKAQVAQVYEEVSDEEQAEAAAVNYRRRAGPQQRQASTSARGSGGQGFKGTRFSGKCFYCLKANHMKKECITRRNDRNKGIFRTNINAPLSNRQQNSSMEAAEVEDEAEVAKQMPKLTTYLICRNRGSNSKCFVKISNFFF